MRSRGFWFAAVWMAGCGLDVVGTADHALPAPDGGAATQADATAPAEGAPPDATPPACTCPLQAPAGWELVAYANDRSAGCVGDLKENNLITAPTTAAGACTCNACTITTPPSCNDGTYTSDYDDTMSASCSTISTNEHNANGGQCVPDSSTLRHHGRANPPKPVGAGVCASTTTPHPEVAKSTGVRVCSRPAGATTCACDPTLAPAYTTCVRHDGDVACPAGLPTKHHVGPAAAIACEPCPCKIDSATCTGTISYYSDTKCMNLFASVDEASCKPTPIDTDYNSIKWTGKTTATCLAGTPPAGTASVADPITICCP